MTIFSYPHSRRYCFSQKSRDTDTSTDIFFPDDSWDYIILFNEESKENSSWSQQRIISTDGDAVFYSFFIVMSRDFDFTLVSSYLKWISSSFWKFFLWFFDWSCIITKKKSFFQSIVQIWIIFELLSAVSLYSEIKFLTVQSGNWYYQSFEI